jgi:hypothetical protein
MKTIHINYKQQCFRNLDEKNQRIMWIQALEKEMMMNVIDKLQYSIVRVKSILVSIDFY